MSAAPLSVVSAGFPPHDRSPARAELGRAISQLTEAVRAHARAREPLDRLNSILREVAQAETRVATCRARDSERLNRWLDEDAAAGRPRPAVSQATIDAERALVELRAEGEAARAALPAREQAFGAAGERVRVATAARDSARLRVAAEIAVAFIETEFRKAA